MKTQIKMVIWALSALMICTIIYSCTKEEEEHIDENSEFEISSNEIDSENLLSIKYTCDGNGSTLPLKWENAPDNTNAYALIMHHEAGPEDVHCYWIVYNIPADISSLSENEKSVGSFGINTVNGKNEYAPPCSKGPGEKAYTYSLYALSEELDISIPSGEINMDFILDQMEDKIISTTSMTVFYSRQFD